MTLLVPTLEVKIECYEGPLAVLVNLIKKNKISIWDIPLSVITERFLEYVELVKEMNLRIAEDFIDMASLLIYIKSKMLLPEHKHEDEDDTGDELVERIIEYERMRSMAENIETLPMLDRDFFYRDKKTIDGRVDYDLHDLCSIFFELIKNKEEKYIVINEIRPTLEDKLRLLKSMLDSTGLFVWDMNEKLEHAEKVATILSMLELTKIKLATISQRRPFGKIILKSRQLTLGKTANSPENTDNFEGDKKE